MGRDAVDSTKKNRQGSEVREAAERVGRDDCTALRYHAITDCACQRLIGDKFIHDRLQPDQRRQLGVRHGSGRLREQYDDDLCQWR